MQKHSVRMRTRAYMVNVAFATSLGARVRLRTLCSKSYLKRGDIVKDHTPIIEVKGVGEKTQKLFQKLDIYTVKDLLKHFPRDYETFGAPVMISDAVAGEICTVNVCVVGIPNLRRIRSLNLLNVTVRDASGGMQLTFFNMPFMKNHLKSGAFYIFRGLVQTRGNQKIMEQPRMYSREEYERQMQSIQPRYALTKGLSNQSVQKAVRQALECYDFAVELYPEDFRSKYRLMTYKEAVCQIHFPTDYDTMLLARRRLVFDEFFTFLLLLQINKDSHSNPPNTFVLENADPVIEFLQKMPFDLTNAQQKVWQEISEDLSGPYCMNRLIQGDVGSGKTIVAVLALLKCVCNGYQGAMMAPTEVLATQHYETICGYIRDYELPFRPILLVGSMTPAQKKAAYAQIESGEANLIIGTHALIQEKVIYRSLALVITDEQHRFGVRQREKLADKGMTPHVLVMSATPIPRTLAIILYGDLNISVIDELPADRLPIKNCVVNTSYRPKAYKFIEGQITLGRQIYVICPMVEEGELEETENVMEYTCKLKAALPENIVIEPLHGKMKPSEKNRIMEDFSAGKIQILVSTTVIEVGINVPNATVMMVENAERFGLAQLHQLRGRVGRGKHQSYCIFVSASEKPDTMKRLEILNHSNDGFFIASEDLKLRGPGDIFGIRQSGDFAFRIGDIYTDAALLKEAADAAGQLLSEDPNLSDKKHQYLRRYLNEVSSNSVDFRSI